VAEIRFTAVHHRFGDRVVLDGIELNLSQHRVGIVGANGSGKSTLARMINGLAVLAAFRDLVPAACREPIR